MISAGAGRVPRRRQRKTARGAPTSRRLEARGDRHPYTLRNAKLTAENLVHAARLIKANPYPTNVKAANMEMMARNKEIWRAQAELRKKLHGGGAE